MRRARITAKQLHEFNDPREMPAYGIREAAHYLQIPAATLKSWVLGRSYETKRFGTQRFEPVLLLPDVSLPLLSFYNLAEAHVLSVFRKDYGIELQNIRTAMDFVASRFGHVHPLIDQEFATDGVTLFIEHLGKTLDASAGGQIVLNFYTYLKRLDRVNDVVARLWPFTRSTTDEESPRSVFIDPRISFGRPSLIKCNVPTVEIAARYKAGDSIQLLAEDYGCDQLDIEEGLRCEIGKKLAA
jgi:uncharacterized protein (DUF433 family)